MRGRHPRRTDTRNRAHTSRDDRYRTHHRHDDIEAGHLRHIGALEGFEAAHAAATASPIDEPNDRDAQIVREQFAIAVLVADGGIGGAAADCEVSATDHDHTAVDLAGPE